MAWLLVDDSPVTADLHGISTEALVGWHELDSALAVPVVVPVHKRRHPLASSQRAGEGPIRVVRLLFGLPEQCFRVRVTFDTRGLEKDLSTPSSSRRLSSVAARMALPLSACRINGCRRPLLIRSRRQALLTRSAAMAGSSRSPTSQATTLRLQTSITK